jgi:uncharacterized protein
MTTISIQEEVDVTAPSLIEGFPGVGLVGKIAADHLVAEFDMTHYANVHCDGLPSVAVYREGDAAGAALRRRRTGPARSPERRSRGF